MRQLLPEPADIDPFVAHARAARPAPADRPWVALNMVASLDGATSAGGVSGGLNTPADKEVFRAIRAIGDVIVAAAGTVRAEHYGPARPSAEVQAARVARGQAAIPRIVVVSRSLDLDETWPLFTEAVERTMVITTASAPADRWAALEPVADLHVAGDANVEVDQLLAVLAGVGARCVVVEGGAVFNGQLVEAGVVDEVNLSVAPLLVGGISHRVAVGAAEAPLPLRLAHLWEAEDLLLGRYVRP